MKNSKGGGSSGRISKALELENLLYIKAFNEINEEAQRAEQTASADLAARGLYQSGVNVKRVIEINVDRAKKVALKRIDLRRDTLQQVGELAAPDYFEDLVQSLAKSIDGILASVPEHLRSRGVTIDAYAMAPQMEQEGRKLQGWLRNEVEILKKQHEFRKEAESEMTHEVVAEVKDRRKVFVVHGRNAKARDATFSFLRAINLDPIEWETAIKMTGKATPYVGDVLDVAFNEAQAIIVLMTGDDVARLGSRFLTAHDGPEERDLTPQARPNVLFEAGMALGRNQDRTVIVSIGKTRPFSDVVGRHLVYMSDDVASRQALASRLKTAGCDVKIDDRTSWHKEGSFIDASTQPDSAHNVLRVHRKAAEYDATASFKEKLRVEFKNTSGRCVEIECLKWIASPIEAKLPTKTIQLQLDGDWWPKPNGLQKLKLPPGEHVRIWVSPPDDRYTHDEITRRSDAEGQLGTLVLSVDGQEEHFVL